MARTEATVTLLLGFAAAGYLAAWSLVWLRRPWPGWVMAGCAWLANLALVALHWGGAGEPPFGTMYHVQVFLGLCFLPLYVCLAGKNVPLRWTGGWFLFLSALPLIGGLFMDRRLVWQRAPALQSAWFVPHVLAYIIGYALAAVAFALTVTGLAAGYGRRKAADTRYAPASEYIVRLAFPFLTFGLVSGALWADRAWGAYWSWDPKETWALITWTLYLIYLHVRLDTRLHRYAPACQVFAFLALLVTFVVVNLVPRFASGLHSYT